MLRKIREEISCKKFALCNIMSISDYARIRLDIGIETKIEINKLEERKPILSLENFALISQIQSQFQFQSVV